MSRTITRWLVVDIRGAARLLQSAPAKMNPNEQAMKLVITIPERKQPPLVEVLVNMPEWPSVTYEVMVGDES